MKGVAPWYDFYLLVVLSAHSPTFRTIHRRPGRPISVIPHNHRQIFPDPVPQLQLSLLARHESTYLMVDQEARTAPTSPTLLVPER
jgi:hypothetical protein